MAKHVIRPIPLVKNIGVSTYKMTHLVGYGSPQNRGSYIWYIEGPKQKVIIDAGSMPGKVPGGPGSIMFPEGRAEQVQTLEDGLAKFGLKPEDIDVIIFTHAHEDHVQLARRYPRARMIIQKAELEFARNPHPIQQFTYHPELIEGLDFDTIEGDRKIVEGISVMLTPGHSAAGQSIIVDTDKGKVVIAGLCTIRRNFEPPPELKVPVISCGINIDPIKCYDSLLRIKQVADIIVPLHDAEFLDVDRIVP